MLLILMRAPVSVVALNSSEVMPSDLTDVALHSQTHKLRPATLQSSIPQLGRVSCGAQANMTSVHTAPQRKPGAIPRAALEARKIADLGYDEDRDVSNGHADPQSDAETGGAHADGPGHAAQGASVNAGRPSVDANRSSVDVSA